jgi:hypothetical protein
MSYTKRHLEAEAERRFGNLLLDAFEVIALILAIPPLFVIAICSAIRKEPDA